MTARRKPSVKDMSLTVADGEFMVLLGPSGCGKSSALRMIAGLEPITAGTVAIDGRAINHVPAKDRDIAMVFQSYALYPHMTVRDNLAFGLRRAEVPRDEIDRRVASVAEKLGLAPFSPASPMRSPAASASGWRSAGPSCAIPRSSCSTSRSPISTRRCASPRATSWSSSSMSSARRRSMSPMTRSRP